MGSLQQPQQPIPNIGEALSPQQRPLVRPGPIPGFLGQIVPEIPDQWEPTPSMVVDLLRPDDLLNLHIEGYNLKLDASDSTHPQLVRADPATPAYLAVQFPLQHIQEQALFEMQDPDKRRAPQLPPSDVDAQMVNSDPPRFGTAPTRARAAGASRLVFRLPDTGPGSSIPYTTAGLLDWTHLTPNLNPRAVPPEMSPDPSVAAPAAPEVLETAIELPFRLLLSPDANSAWAHEYDPVTHAGRTEVWHTRLVLPGQASPTETSVDTPAYVRALWSRDYNSAQAHQFEVADPFRASLTPYDRRQIVRLSSDFRLDPAMAASGMGGTAQALPAWGAIQHPIPDAVRQNPALEQPGQIAARPASPIAIGVQNAGVVRPGHILPLIEQVVKPIAVERLMLSPLGGWLTSRGAWDPLHTSDPVREDTLAVSEWRHIASQGRDAYVRVVYEGYLFPFGHRASLIKVTERKFLTAPSGPFTGTPFAYLRQHMYIVVRQPTVTYPDAAFTNQGREMPLKVVQLTTLVTPDIAPPEQTSVAGDASAFWVTTAEGRFPFHVHATDAYGHSVDFTAPLVFMVGAQPPQTKGQPAQPDPINAARLTATVAGYGNDLTAIRSSVQGQKVTYAPPVDASSDTTSLTTDALIFTAQAAPAMASGYIPALRQADVRLSSVEHLLGRQAATTIALFDDYVTHGFAGGGPGVFAQFVQPIATVFSADKGGGIATPNMNLVGLSQQLGPVAGLVSSPADLHKSLQDVASNLFNPSQFFTDAGATLFGSVKLPDLFDAILPAGDHAPKITTRALPQGAANPTTIETSFEWHPRVKATGSNPSDYILGLLETNTPHGSQTKFDLSGKSTATLADPTGAPSFLMKGSLTAFTLHFFEIIDVAFESFTFTAQSGHKTDVKVNLAADNPVVFQGPLAFVNTLEHLIPAGGFGGNGPTLDLTPTQAQLGYTLALPPISCGVLSLQHVSFGASLVLPFLDGKPQVDFAFAERSHPFLLTVEIFGGGGFFHVQLDTQAVQIVEGSFEFGGNFALDLGVASGGVHVLAGIYFKLAASQTNPSVLVSLLDGFVHLGGELSVLGLISASLEFDLDLSYDSGTHEARGTATLTVAVSVAFFSTSVDLTVERSFGGSPGDPTFQQVVSAADWSAYAAAFS